MNRNKTKCTCAQKGIKCGRRLSLIKQGISTEQKTSEEFICPLKAALLQAS